MKPLLITGGRLIDPALNFDDRADLIIEDGLVTEVGLDLQPPPGGERLNVEGLIIFPGLIDMHVHLRDPGYEYKEDIFSGARAAAAGGFTAVAAMANTDPVADDPSVIRYVLDRASGAPARVYPIGAVTSGLEGKRLAEMGRMKLAGAVAFSDDGRPLSDGGLMRNAFQYAAGIGALLILHEEDLGLASNGVMHEGPVSAVLGLRGIPATAEEAMISRDLMLLRLTGARAHFAHLSSAGAVELVRRAKADGLPVSAEVTPHHLFLTERAVRDTGYSTDTKVNPPLRSEQDRQALWKGLVDGTIDVIASDHAPHHRDDKDVEFDFAPFGIAGLETTLPLLLDEALSGRVEGFTLSLLAGKLSTAPARILGVPGGTLQVGSPADLTMVDPLRSLTVDPETWYSKSRNTPFKGRHLTGAAVYTVVGGRIMMREGVVAEQ